MGAVSWVLMVAMGGGAMWCMRYTPDWADFILVRFAGFCFIGAGLVGAAGWVGAFMNGTFGWLFSGINDLTSSAFGSGVAWIIAAGLTFLWIGAMLPDRLFSYDPPDWLVISGIIVPALVAKVPGKAGAAADTVLTWGGQTVTGWVGGIFS